MMSWSSSEQLGLNPRLCLISILIVMSLLTSVNSQYRVENCPPVDSTFELVTGWMFSAPQSILETKSGVLQLPDCLSACKNNVSCQALNFETGLCVLFKSQAGDKKDELIKSQFPVFTMYAQKLCLPSARSCERAWAFELVRGFYLKDGGRKQMEMPTRTACMDACVQEREFPCRSAWFDSATGGCVMSEIDRYSLSQPNPFVPSTTYDFMESQCVPEPNKMCEFKKIEDRLVKTVDSLQEGIVNLDECRALCLNATFRCHTFDFYEGVCRLSHHSAVTLTQIEEPYLTMNGSISWERGPCYNVSLECGSNHLIAHLSTNKVFNGKVYSRSKPKSCVVDVVNNMNFEISMDYTDPICGVKQTEPGRFTTDLVLQHHDQIMTSADLGFALRCSFHLEDQTVAHGIELQVNGQIQSMASESSVVPAPNVTMRITNRVGGDINTAQVGDPLSLRFEIVDANSPYEIFVRELIAMDGVDGAEITLIDVRGCPTDPSIMGSVSQVNFSGKILQAPFEAFKFPTSEIVQFQALVTPCLPSCQPVDCSVAADPSIGGDSLLESQSFGRRRRRSPRNSNNNGTVPLPDNLLVVNSIKISDPFKSQQQLREQENKKRNGWDYELGMDGEEVTTSRSSSGSCLNAMTLFLCGSVLLIVQLAIIVAWLYLWRRKHSMSKGDEVHNNYFYSSHNMKPLPLNSHHQQPQFSRKFLQQASGDIPNLPRITS